MRSAHHRLGKRLIGHVACVTATLACVSGSLGIRYLHPHLHTAPGTRPIPSAHTGLRTATLACVSGSLGIRYPHPRLRERLMGHTTHPRQRERQLGISALQSRLIGNHSKWWGCYSRWYQTIPYYFRLFQIISDNFRLIQINPDIPDYFRLFQIRFRIFQIISD